jgi:heme exporter protein A
MTAPTALKLDRLTVMRGDRVVLRDLSFEVRAGEAVVLTGPNGAGKTTVLRTIAGLLAPAAGTVRLLREAGETDATVGEQCHFLGHLNGIRPALTVRENAAFWSDVLGGSPDRMDNALDVLRLADLAGIQASYLSAGQKRRLGLVRLLLADRPVWLLDEPAVSLDVASREVLAGAVNAFRRRGGIVVATTHQPLGFEHEREVRLEPTGRHAIEAEDQLL